MLSIRRRQGPYEFRKETFGDPEQSWPNWAELGPILLRSAGIVGIAGIIMMIAAGDTFFRGAVRGPRAQSATEAAPEAKSEPTQAEVATATAASETEALEPSQPAEGAGGVLPAEAHDEPAPRVQLAATVPEDASPEEASKREVAPNEIVSAPQSAAAAIDAGTLRLEPVDEFDPLAFVSADPAPAAEPAGPRAAEMSASAPGDRAPVAEPAEAEPIAAEPIAVATVGAAVEQGSAEDDGVDVPALSAARSVQDAATGQPAGQTDQESLWAGEAAACPRDWLSSSAPTPATSLSEDCEPQIVLVAPVDSEEADADAAEPPLDEALENAAATHALELAGFVARLPRARPDPPPVRRVRNNRRADWPAEPPPDCGSLHAYWRFVDRKRGIKEWYCR